MAAVALFQLLEIKESMNQSTWAPINVFRLTLLESLLEPFPAIAAAD